MSTATETASTIRQQITPGVLMSLGAHNLGHYINDRQQIALVFMARVLPFKVNGERSQRPRLMRVMVTHIADNTYTVNVDYRRGQKIVSHFAAHAIPENLSAVLLAVDSDDDLQHAHIGHENRVTG